MHSAGKVDPSLKVFKRLGNISPLSKKSPLFSNDDEDSSEREDHIEISDGGSQDSDNRTSPEFFEKKLGRRPKRNDSMSGFSLTVTNKLQKRKTFQTVKRGNKFTSYVENNDFDNSYVQSDENEDQQEDIQLTAHEVEAASPKHMSEVNPVVKGLMQRSGTRQFQRQITGNGPKPEDNTFLLRKNSPFITLWNFIIFFCILLDLIIIPFEVCLQDVEYISNVGFIIINLIQLVYIADIYVNLKKTYYDSQVREVTDSHSIQIRYFESSDFAVDLFTCAPLLAFRKIYYYPKGYNQLFLLIRIIKSFKIKGILVEFHQKYHITSSIYFIGYLISVLTILHLESCVWYSVTMNRYLTNARQPEQMPLCYTCAPCVPNVPCINPENPDQLIACPQVCPNDWVSKEMLWLPPTYRNIEHDDLFKEFYEGPIIHRYSFIFYSCVLISAGNEIAPLSNAEAWLASFYVILGLILTGVILGNISDSIQNMNEEETNYERSLDELQIRLKQNKIPDDIQEKVLVYMQYCHQEEIQFDKENDDFAYLARVLRKEYLTNEYNDMQTSVPLFRNLDKDEVYEICSHFKTWIYLPGDTIVRQGEPCKEFFFIRKGRVKLYDSYGKVEAILEEGKSINELSFVFDSIVLNTVIADDFCILDVLTKEAYEEMQERRPDITKDIIESLKTAKDSETKDIVQSLQKIPFFSEFTYDELKIFYKEYMSVIYLNPNVLVTSPTYNCNAIYFIIQGTINRYERTDWNYNYIKSRINKEDDEEEEEEDYDTFIEHIDSQEKEKALLDTPCLKILTKNDWLGNIPINKTQKNHRPSPYNYYDVTESITQLVYITSKNLEDLMSPSKTAMILYERFKTAYRNHIYPISKIMEKDMADDNFSTMGEDKAAKEAQINKNLKEILEVITTLYRINDTRHPARSQIKDKANQLPEELFSAPLSFTIPAIRHDKRNSKKE